MVGTIILRICMRPVVTLLTNTWQAWQNYALRLLLCITVMVLTAQLPMASAYATGVYDFPALIPGNWIVDQAEVLSRSSESNLSTRLEELAQQTGKEVRVVTLHRLDYGETPQSLANQLFEKWFPTPEAQANQVLLLIDNVTNGTAIRFGDKVKDVLSEPIAQSIAQETVMVPVRQGNYNQAFLDAGDRLIAVLSGKADPGPPIVIDTIRTEGTFKTAAETDTNSATIIVVGFLVAATVIPMATYYFYQFMQSR